MIENTRDIFYIVLSFCVFWLTVFLCWGLYYFIQTFKQTNEMLKTLRVKIADLSNMMDLLRGKAVAFLIKKVTSIIKAQKNKKEK